MYYRPFTLHCVQTIMAYFNLTQDPTTFPPVKVAVDAAVDLQ